MGHISKSEIFAINVEKVVKIFFNISIMLTMDHTSKSEIFVINVEKVVKILKNISKLLIKKKMTLKNMKIGLDVNSAINVTLVVI